MDRRVIASGGRRAARRRPQSVAWATRKAFDAAGGPPGATLKGGGYRTTGRAKALARCASIAPHAFPSLSSDIRRAAPVHGEKAGLGPGFIVSAATGVSGWFGGLGVTTSTALAVIAGFLVYRLSRWRTARTASHEEAADKP